MLANASGGCSVNRLYLCLRRNLNIRVVQIGNLIDTEFSWSKIAVPLNFAALFGRTPRTCLRPALRTCQIPNYCAKLDKRSSIPHCLFKKPSINFRFCVCVIAFTSARRHCDRSTVVYSCLFVCWLVRSFVNTGPGRRDFSKFYVRFS